MPATKTTRRRNTAQSRRGGQHVNRIDQALARKTEALLTLDIGYIPHDDFADEDAGERLDGILAASYAVGRLPKPPAAGSLPAYFARLYETPLLTREEEHDLFWAMNYLKYRANLLRLSLDTEHPDEMLIGEIDRCLQRSRDLRDRIVQANLRLVVSLARKFTDAHSSFEELVSDGNLTLLNAVEKFDCSRGFRFSTYATHATQRDYYRQIQRRRKNARRITGEQNEFLDQLPVDVPDDDVPLATQSALFRKVMQAFADELDEREQHIVSARFGINEQESGQTLRAVGEQLGISKERVRQLQLLAVEKLKEAVQAAGDSDGES